MSPEVFWSRRTPVGDVRRLEGDVEAEVVVVGGGVAGLTCARTLVEAGISTVLVEAATCGAGASGRSSGFVTPASEIDLHTLVAGHGKEEARRLWDFVRSGVAAIRADVLEHRLACDHRVQDSLLLADDAAGLRAVRAEHDAHRELGYAARLVDAEELALDLGTERYRGGMRHGETFGIDPYAYCRGLCELVSRRGGAVYERSPVTDLTRNGVSTARGSVRARHVVLCADRFLPDLGALRAEVYHAQTFLAVSRPLSADTLRALRGSDRVLAWDTRVVYGYFRIVDGDRLLLGGGDLLTTYSRSAPARLEPHADRLLRDIRRTFPGIELELDAVWPGMLGVSKDLLPVMGHDPSLPGVWCVGAATGLPWASALGSYAAERILSGRDDLDRALCPERRFAIGPRLQAILSRPIAYALSHAVARYAPGTLGRARGPRA